MGVDLGTAPVDMGTPPPLTGGGGCSVSVAQPETEAPFAMLLTLALCAAWAGRRRGGPRP
jgi:MYXO-CTERM domain-containing protein